MAARGGHPGCCYLWPLWVSEGKPVPLCPAALAPGLQGIDFQWPPSRHPPQGLAFLSAPPSLWFKEYFWPRLLLWPSLHCQERWAKPPGYPGEWPFALASCPGFSRGCAKGRAAAVPQEVTGSTPSGRGAAGGGREATQPSEVETCHSAHWVVLVALEMCMGTASVLYQLLFAASSGHATVQMRPAAAGVP